MFHTEPHVHRRHAIKLAHDLGWTSFQFQWITDTRMAIYCVVIAAVWQTTGFVMAMFLAGLRGVDTEQINAARVDLPQHGDLALGDEARSAGLCHGRPQQRDRSEEPREAGLLADPAVARRRRCGLPPPVM